jgi:hypothetical protein
MGIKGYIVNVDYEKYVSEISKYSHRNYKLGPVASRILRLFLERPYQSTYQLFTLLKKEEKMAYKNVHKRIKKLHSLKMIEIIGKESIKTDRESIHNPKFYRLTTGGIFHLLCQGPRWGSKKIFQNYPDNIIFRTILYRYIERETLLQIKNLFLLGEIFSYLSKCCVATNRLIEALGKHRGTDSVTMPLFNWDEFPGKNNMLPLMFFTFNFGLNLLGNPQIKKIDDGRTIEISTKNKSVFIKLNEKKNAATLTTEDGKRFLLDVEHSDNKIIVNGIIGTYRESNFERLAYDIQYNLLTLSFSIIMKLSKWDFVQVAAEENSNSFEILAHDQKTMYLLEKTKQLFEERYKTFQLKTSDQLQK